MCALSKLSGRTLTSRLFPVALHVPECVHRVKRRQDGVIGLRCAGWVDVCVSLDKLAKFWELPLEDIKGGLLGIR